MSKKLSRREAALVAHARRRAVAEYKTATTFKLECCPPGCWSPRTLRQFNLAQLERLNIINSEPVYFVSLVSQWRK